MELAWQFVGALGILVPFALLQLRRTTTGTLLYQGLNFAGATVLTYLAVVESQWGFVILQGAWALAALAALARRVTPRPGE